MLFCGEVDDRIDRLAREQFGRQPPVADIAMDKAIVALALGRASEAGPQHRSIIED